MIYIFSEKCCIPSKTFGHYDRLFGEMRCVTYVAPVAKTCCLMKIFYDLILCAEYLDTFEFPGPKIQKND